MDYAWALVALAVVVASWDAFRRYVEKARFNADALDEVRQLRERADRAENAVKAMHERMQSVALAARARGPMGVAR